MSRRPSPPRRGATPATVALEAAGVAHSLHPYEHDPAGALGFGLEAAAAIGVPADRVLKTLVAVVTGAAGPGAGAAPDELVVAVVPVAGSLDLKALALALGARRASMAEPAAAERATGYVVGGISPLGQRRRLRTVVDASALTHEVVYVSGGRRGLDLGLAPGDLVRLTGAVTAAVARAGR
ncbi:Cys-tRNA(Pro) deacylase [Cellulomonas sp. PhB143]|uniref:Cys-tRNA(Pro) deacylase n=1 Tax=Cellulomonas sp. PhB143 TaxID=2485186 RepID=UPI000F47268A|nr:Cys-tRNA(Pro) deacylase [Cellulomonas sp. PhB143]ROS73535.1 Cys-tRNA(Pro)/Cys-tRNA(Cys) deacylase [Cellulomonas sp. PhB143]